MKLYIEGEKEMKALEYPFDSNYIIRNRKKIKRQLSADDSFIEKKIAVLGGSTTKDIVQTLELFLLNNHIRPTFYESEYNMYYEDAVFDNNDLEEFAPDLIYICTSNHNITEYPIMSDSAEKINDLIENEFNKFTAVWRKLTEKYHCPIIQNNFEMPYLRLLGNRDIYDIHGASNFLMRLNAKFYEYAQNNDNFYICDINYISADYGLRKWSDPFYWHMYKYAVAVPAIPYLSFNVANIIKSLLGKNKKGFVLDLDNTLWGGVIGDDGADNIVLGPEESKGQAYTAFQKYLKSFQQLGIILTINSKNDYDNAIAGINHPDSEFKEDDFISIKANWQPKDKNFIEIANELNLLPESLVFVDDNPAERHIVAEQISGGSVPNLTDIMYFEEIIDRSGFFEQTNISNDDLHRTEMYKENAARTKLQSSFADYGEYLKSLEMKAFIRPFESVYMARIAQLTNKSNQFNLTTRRYTQAEIESIANDENYITLYAKLEDRFGDNGVVSVVIGHVIDSVCHIDLWLMSCRVLKRDLEYAMLDSLVDKCRKLNLRSIAGYYYPTKKNAMVKEFYKDMGFDKLHEDNEGNSTWVLNDLEKYDKKNHFIDII